MNAELFLKVHSTLGEGPCWDDKKLRLLWVDIEEKRVHTYEPQKELHQSISLDQHVGAVVPTVSGKWIAALQHGFYHIDPKTGNAELIHDPEANKPGNRFNDGKCDPAGRFWAGTMALSGEGNAGALYRMDSNFKIKQMLTGIGISNGLAWSADAKVMYYIDSPTRSVVAFDYDLSTGEIANGRTVIEVPKAEGMPDGMAIDEEGNLWIAHWGGWQVSCWDPLTGIRRGAIRLPVAQVTSCAFGGPSQDELFITTASIGLGETERREQPLAGCLFRARLDVKGPPALRF
jgi:sugar lactone lactonase YvrE